MSKAGTLCGIYRQTLAQGAFKFRQRGCREPSGCDSFRRGVEAAARRLDESGIGAGDVVLYQGSQHPGALVAFWATVLRGAVFAPVDPDWPEFLCRYAVTLARPRAVVHDHASASKWDGLVPEATQLPVEELSPDAGIGSTDAAAWRDTEPSPLPPETAAVYLFTSGSTGRPKAVVLSHSALALSAALAVKAFGWNRGDTLANLAEPHTMSGLRNAFVAAPLGGLQWLCLPRQERASVFDLLARLDEERAQRIVAAPILLRQINLLADKLPRGALGSLLAVYCTGADLSRNEVIRFHRRFAVPVVNYYGLTETAGLCIAQPVEGWDCADESLGQAVGGEVRIVGEHGGELPEGKVGELQVRTPQQMSGYLGDPEATARRFAGDWLRTGDLAQRDAAGGIRLAGRREDFIKTAHTDLVHPREIEAVLERHEAIADVAVCGYTDASGAERLAALIVHKQADAAAAPAARQLAAYVAAHLGAHRTPTRFKVVQTLPRSSNGKLQRTGLKAILDETDANAAIGN